MLNVSMRMEDAAESAAVLDGLRILLVDDNPDARLAIAEVLKSCGAEVIPVASGAAALATLPQARPDVLVSDIAMPDMDGHRLMHGIRALDVSCGGATPAAALSAYASSADCARALLAGYQIYLAKPFDPAELVMLVARLAGRQSS